MATSATKESVRILRESKTADKATRPYSAKSRQEEPRGRPANGQPLLSGATEDDPLVSVQILKVRQSVWRELAEAAAEKTWHRSVLVRKILDEWVEKRKLLKKRAGKVAGKVA